MRSIILTSLAAASLTAIVSTSCGSQNKTEQTPLVEYDGQTWCTTVKTDATVDTIFNFDGTQVASTRISRFKAAADSNFYASVNVYGNATNEVINGAFAKYIEEVFSTFQSNDESTDKAIGVDSLKTAGIAELTSVVDGCVGYFNNEVIPTAQKDSVIATNLSVEIKPVWADDSYVTYAMASGCYYGGAHGEEDFYLMTFDSKTGAQMGFYNLIPADKQDQMREKLLDVISRTDDQTVESYLAMVNQWIGNDKSESWTVKTFPIYHVALTGQGYVFCYPKYSIAPGAAGCPIYVVPE